MKTMKVVIWCAIGAFVVGVSVNAALVSGTPTPFASDPPTLLVSSEQHDTERAGKLLAFGIFCNRYYVLPDSAIKELDNRYGEGTGAKAKAVYDDEVKKIIAESVEAMRKAKRTNIQSGSCPRLARELGL